MKKLTTLLKNGKKWKFKDFVTANVHDNDNKIEKLTLTHLLGLSGPQKRRRHQNNKIIIFQLGPMSERHFVNFLHRLKALNI